MPKGAGHGPQPRYDMLAALDYIDTFQRSYHHRSPSQRQIQAALGISAPSVVHYMVQRMIRAGLLTTRLYGRGRAADLVLTRAGRAELASWRAERAANPPPKDPPPPDPPEDGAA